MIKQTIDEQKFQLLCKEAWDQAESKGEMGLPTYMGFPETPFLWELEDRLCQHFKISHKSEIEEDEERIYEIMSSRNYPPFKYNVLVKRYITKARRKYGEEATKLSSSQRHRKQRGAKKQLRQMLHRRM